MRERAAAAAAASDAIGCVRASFRRYERNVTTEV